MKIIEIFGDRIKKNEPLSRHTTYRLGGPADFYFAAKTPEEAAEALAVAKEDGLEVFIMGGGSNILVSDAGFRGLVVSYAARTVTVEGDRVAADAGAIFFSMVKASIEAGLTGLEWASGIPGTVGGAIRGNAGAYGGEIKDSLETVQALRIDTGELRSFKRADCAFGYRDSLFKREPWFIVRAIFALSPGDKQSGLSKMKEIIGLRQSKQPLEFGNAGSVFKSYVFGDVSAIPSAIANAVPPQFIDYGRIPAAWIFDRLGIKGKTLGGAQISQKHGNYFVNTGRATASEVRELIGYAKMKAYHDLGIKLEEEIEYVGF